MSGDDRVRLCGECDKHVYDLSEMTTAEAEDLLAAHGEELCVRFYQRDDGTVMTSDCRVGVSKRRRRRVAATAIALAAGVAGATGVAWATVSGGTAMPSVDTSCPSPPPEPIVKPPEVVETPAPVPQEEPPPPPRHKTMGRIQIRR
jgi:hypothetical protein